MSRTLIESHRYLLGALFGDHSETPALIPMTTGHDSLESVDGVTVAEDKRFQATDFFGDSPVDGVDEDRFDLF